MDGVVALAGAAQEHAARPADAGVAEPAAAKPVPGTTAATPAGEIAGKLSFSLGGATALQVSQPAESILHIDTTSNVHLHMKAAVAMRVGTSC